MWSPRSTRRPPRPQRNPESAVAGFSQSAAVMNPAATTSPRRLATMTLLLEAYGTDTSARLFHGRRGSGGHDRSRAHADDGRGRTGPGVDLGVPGGQGWAGEGE